MLFCLLDSLLKIIDVPNKTQQKTHDRLVHFSLAKELMCYVLTTKMLTLPPGTHQQTPNEDATKISVAASPPWSKCDQKLRRLGGLRCLHKTHGFQPLEKDKTPSKLRYV